MLQLKKNTSEFSKDYDDDGVICCLGRRNIITRKKENIKIKLKI